MLVQFFVIKKKIFGGRAEDSKTKYKVHVHVH